MELKERNKKKMKEVYEAIALSWSNPDYTMYESIDVKNYYRKELKLNNEQMLYVENKLYQNYREAKYLHQEMKNLTFSEMRMLEKGASGRLMKKLDDAREAKKKDRDFQNKELEKYRFKDKNILWFSQHEMTKDQENALKVKYGNMHITQINKTVSSMREIEDEIKKADIVAMVGTPEMQAQALEIAKGKPVITAVSDRVLVKNPDGGESKAEFIFNRWEKINKIEINKKKYNAVSDTPKRVLWFSRHEMTPEQKADLNLPEGSEIIQVDKTIKSASEIKDEINAADIVAVVAPIELQKEFLELTNGKPVLTGVNQRIPQEDGKFQFKHDHWDQVNSIVIDKRPIITKRITDKVKDNLQIIGTTLLSDKEYEKYRGNIFKIKDDWWLRSPGYDSGYAWNVGSGGLMGWSNCHYRVDNVGVGVRPALQIFNLGLKVGDKVEFDDKTFTVISPEYALCDKIIERRAFRKDWEAKDANVYEASDVKKFVDDWFEKAKAKEREKTKSKKTDKIIHDLDRNVDARQIEKKFIHEKKSKIELAVNDKTIKKVCREMNERQIAAKEVIEKTLGMTLLSIDEYNKYEKNIQTKYKCWLRSPGYYSYKAYCVTYQGDYGWYCYPNYVHEDYNIGVRPALQISNLSNLEIGDKIKFGEDTFTVISPEYALCDKIIERRAFRKDWEAKDANVYEASDVKKFVDDWFERTREHEKTIIKEFHPVDYKDIKRELERAVERNPKFNTKAELLKRIPAIHGCLSKTH